MMDQTSFFMTRGKGEKRGGNKQIQSSLDRDDVLTTEESGCFEIHFVKETDRNIASKPAIVINQIERRE